MAQLMQSHRWSTACACGLPLERESRQRPDARLIRTGYCVPVLLQTPPEHEGGTPTQPRRHSAGTQPVPQQEC